LRLSQDAILYVIFVLYKAGVHRAKQNIAFLWIQLLGYIFETNEMAIPFKNVFTILGAGMALGSVFFVSLFDLLEYGISFNIQKVRLFN
jgi:hypothetical protein